MNNLPHSLTHLELTEEFNQEIDLLPDNIEYILIDITNKVFNKKINKLPAKLKTIILPSKYPYEIEHLRIPGLTIHYHNKKYRHLVNL